MGRVLGWIALLAVSPLIVTGSATAATASITIADEAVAVAGGQRLIVFVEVRCSTGPGEQLLEGNLSVSQGGASGQAGLTPKCDGRTHLHAIRLTSFGAPFEPGQAFASAFLLFLDEQGSTSSFGASENITVR